MNNKTETNRFERGDVVAFGRTGHVAWVVGHVSVNGVVVHSDRATRYLRDNDLYRLRVLCPAHVTPDLETARGSIVAGLRDRQRMLEVERLLLDTDARAHVVLDRHGVAR